MFRLWSGTAGRAAFADLLRSRYGQVQSAVVGAAIALVFLFVAVLSIVVIVGRFRFNAKIARGRAVASGRRPGPDRGPRVAGVDTYESGRSVPASDVLRYSEDGIYRAGRPVGISAGVFAVATVGLVALLLAGDSQTTWLPVVVMFFSGMLVIGTFMSARPGIRVRDDGITIGQVTYTERHPRPGFSEKMGVPHFVAELPFDDVVAIRFLRGAEIITVRDAIRASAPPRMANKPTKARKQVLGLFYTSGLSDAMYIRIRPDRIPPVPLLATSTGMGSSTTRATTWSGPELLIGTKHPLELQRAVRDALDSYHLGGGHPIPVQLPESGRSSK